MKKSFKNLVRYSEMTAAGLLLMIVLFGGNLSAAAESESGAAIQNKPPGKCRVLSQSAEISFPFDIFRGDIRYECRVNGHPVKMLLDDGYMWDELLFWGGPEVDSLGLHYEGTVEVGGGDSTAANLLTSRTASGITVGFPQVEFTEQKAVVMASASGTAKLWWGSAGQISAMLFKHFIVDINFDEMKITLTEPEKFKYDGQGAEIAWEPLGYGPQGIPATLELSEGRQIPLKLLMDLGYNDQLQLWTGKENKIPIPDKVLPATLGMNIQGIPAIGFVGRLPKIKIGKYEVNNVLSAFVPEKDSAQSPCEAMIGLGLLSRFNLTFDYYGRRLIIRPNNRFKEPFEYNMAGFVHRRNPEGFIEIGRIYDNSPASEAGLQVGDRVIKINGRPIGDYDIFEILSLLKQEGKTVILIVAREGREWEVGLILRRLI